MNNFEIPKQAENWFDNKSPEIVEDDTEFFKKELDYLVFSARGGIDFMRGVSEVYRIELLAELNDKLDNILKKYNTESDKTYTELQDYLVTEYTKMIDYYLEQEMKGNDGVIQEQKDVIVTRLDIEHAEKVSEIEASIPEMKVEKERLEQKKIDDHLPEFRNNIINYVYLRASKDKEDYTSGDYPITSRESYVKNFIEKYGTKLEDFLTTELQKLQRGEKIEYYSSFNYLNEEELEVVHEQTIQYISDLLNKIKGKSNNS